MPIISRIGTRSTKVRLVYGMIFAVLIVGSLSMLYPFALMLSGSVKSDTDFFWVTPYPRYLVRDDILYMKYIESKYGKVMYAEPNRWEQISSWRHLEPPHKTDQKLLEDFLAFRKSADLRPSWYLLGHTLHVGENRRLYVEHLKELFDHDIAAYASASSTGIRSWSTVMPPFEIEMYSRRYRSPKSSVLDAYTDFKATRPPADRIVVDIDGHYWRKFLLPKYGVDIQRYNKEHGSSYRDYHQVFLTARAPEEQLARQDWEQFVREELGLAFIRLDPAATDVYQKFLARQPRYADGIENLNKAYGTTYRSFDQVPLLRSVPVVPIIREDWSAFVKAPDCPLENVEVYGPRQAFEQFVAERRGVGVETISPLRMPTEQADYHELINHTGRYRWEFFRRNYLLVFDYILLHGNGIKNTIIFCLLMVGTQLLVNPLAAYALSRYKPPSTYKILLFCMATMAFPAEVTMIPAFLLLKRFPLWPLLVGAVTAFGIIYALAKIAPRVPEWIRGVAGIGLGVATGYLVVPRIMVAMGYAPAGTLLNSFTALVWPAMANGFFIFLLKGFFDSLPQELYEAADIDGAGEFTKFWTITMSLSKPILAVIALSAFTGAYSAFMQALIIIPDQEMWTIMVWIFQLNARYSTFQPVVYASLVIAAVPTLLVFVFCQNIIIRGIVVPIDK